MKVAIALLALIAVAAAADSLTFDSWKSEHQKTYSHPREEMIRKAIWTKNMDYINEFNAENGHSYTLGMNEFGDMSHNEFQRLYLGTKIDTTKVERTGAAFEASAEAPEDTVDWRTKGYVTPVKNQGQCGSCWAFSTTGSLEGQHFAKTGKLVSLSEQNLVDCSRAEGNMGCNGGLMDQAFDYIKKNNGIDTEASYPYTARDGTCHFKSSEVGATVQSHTDVTKDSESALQSAVGSVGPISIAIDASHMSFQFYKNGVYDPSDCSSTQLDHGVLAVGYGTSTKDYWLVKNSWGKSWGMEGYINMVRNAGNKCGVASSASYPTV